MRKIGIYAMFLGAVVILVGISPMVQIGGKMMMETIALGIGIALAGLIISRE